MEGIKPPFEVKKGDRSKKFKRVKNDNFKKGLIWCSSCMLFYPKSQFYRGSVLRNYGYANHCKECAKKDGKLPNAIKRRLGYFRGRKKKAVDAMGGKCAVCGYNRFFGAMSFHHIDPSTKESSRNITHLGTWEEVLAKLDNCALVCENCHREIEWCGEFKGKFVKGNLGYTYHEEAHD